MGGVQLGWGGGVGKWGDECSVNGGDEERLLSIQCFIVLSDIVCLMGKIKQQQRATISC